MQSTSINIRGDSRNSVAHQEVPCSPLLMTVLEQLDAKLTGKLLEPSDALAITSFIRKLVFKLLSKQQNLDFLRAVVDKVDASVHAGLFPQYPSITMAIRREISILRTALCHLQSDSKPQLCITGPAIQEFLDRIEQVPTR